MALLIDAPVGFELVLPGVQKNMYPIMVCFKCAVTLALSGTCQDDIRARCIEGYLDHGQASGGQMAACSKCGSML